MLPFHTLRLLHDKLVTAVWVARQLEINITRQSQYGDPYRTGGKSNDTPLVFDDRASEAAWVLRNTLLVYAAEAGSSTTGSTPSIAAGLLERVTRIESPEAYDEISSAVELGKRTIDSPERRVYLGDCRCGNRLFGDPDDDVTECESCQRGVEVDYGETRSRITRSALTATEMVRYLEDVEQIRLRASTIRVWAHRGRLQAVDTDDRGDPKYCIEDVLDLL